MKKKDRSKVVRLTTIGSMKGTPTYPKPRKQVGWMKFKSYREGAEAGEEGQPRSACPYQLSEDVVQLLLKRDRWIRGWEATAYTKKGLKATNRRIDDEQHKLKLKKLKDKGSKKKHRE